ncbi:hypothetical protein AMATHDRAFT_49600 [Amanita thiersii Skay4041]|uniref:Uncharacterized protein n=1 Tax=Amanita thiersii Skay4041 TaxID=703135 RepID=A0A2A9NJ94_9AGAR|nr:hypothetical protein AMATHDRAFT_49600 [Amanita thiersii Skay4041]
MAALTLLPTLPHSLGRIQTLQWYLCDRATDYWQASTQYQSQTAKPLQVKPQLLRLQRVENYTPIRLGQMQSLPTSILMRICHAYIVVTGTFTAVKRGDYGLERNLERYSILDS